MNNSGGAIAHAHPATIPAPSLSCSLPNFTNTAAVREEKITLSRMAATAEAVLVTPKMRKMQANRAG
jgi:hypothetical protein